MHDFRRTFLWLSLALIGYLIYASWIDFNRPQSAQLAQEASTAAQQTETNPLLPTTPQATSEPSTQRATAPISPIPQQIKHDYGSIEVETDLMRLGIALEGGGIHKLSLLQYPIAVDQPQQPLKMLYQDGNRFYAVNGGLLSQGQNQPNHLTIYEAAQLHYRLPSGQDLLRVPLEYRAENGNRFIKTYEFKRGDYAVTVEYRIEALHEPWQGYVYAQIERSNDPSEDVGFGFLTTVPSYRGAAIYTQEDRYQKVSFDDMLDADLSVQTPSGWVAMLEHHFVSAAIPEDHAKQAFYSRVFDEARYVIGMKSLDPLFVARGTSGTLSNRLYIGPKDQSQLQKTAAEGLKRTVDYGWLTPVSDPLFWLLSKINGLVHNWGLAIVLLTVLIKLIFYPLSAAGYRSMAKMKKFQPRLASLKERYQDDKQEFNRALMEIYKKEKINPLGGCLPILVQIPVFIALYWVLLESVEMRQAPLGLWIQDLSVRDPYFVLPLLMGATMLGQQLLNPAPLDATQRNIMRALPIVFTILFMWFPAGLVLYWLVNNVLSLLQQWYVTRQNA